MTTPDPHTLKRAILEFFRPSLRCDRLGCESVERRMRIMKSSRSYSWVAETYWAYFMECKNCGKQEPFHREKFIQGYHGVTMSSANDDELTEKGWIPW